MTMRNTTATFAGIVTLALAALLPAAPGADAATYHSTRWGYTLTLPAGWTQLPDSAMDQFRGTLNAAAAQTVVFEAGFAPARGPSSNAAYVLAEVVPYPQDREPNDRDMEALVRQISGADVQKTMRDVTKDPSVAEGVSGAGMVGKPQLDLQQRTFTWVIELDRAGVGKVRALARGHFARHALVQIVSNASAADFARYAPAFAALDNSLRFDPGAAYDPAQAAAGGLFSGVASGAMRGAMVGGIAGGLAGVALWLVRKFKGKAKPPANPPA